MTSRTVMAAIAGACALSVAGCSTVVSHIVQPDGKPLVFEPYELRPPGPMVSSFRAGVGKSDITPPAGFPTGGHGPAGALARGAWTRLHARAFVFISPEGQVAVFVSADLFAIPGGLTAGVARAVGTKWNPRGITVSPDAITIAATHTHQSPGNFMTASSYNAYGSKYSGFSEELFRFLLDRIEEAIDTALYDALEHGDASVAFHTGVASDLQLNRSPRTFLINRDAQSVMNDLQKSATVQPPCIPKGQRGEARKDWRLPGCPRLRAADPNIAALEIRRGSTRIGAMIFFAVHPTVLDHHAPVYSSDFVGVAMSTLERQAQLGPAGASPVFGFFNGAEGDVVPRRRVRDIRDVVGLAKAFAAEISTVLATDVPTWPSPPITIRAIDIAAGAACAPDEGGEWDIGKLAGEPVMGAPALGGGEDDRTLLFDLGFREGLHEIARHDQGGKLPGLDSQLLPFIRLTSTFAPPRTWPATLPLRYIEIGPLIVAALPGEPSTATGYRIRQRLAQKDRPIVLIGLANEYTGYIATADEYSAQDYMAASTIWGPGEATVFGCVLATLQGTASHSPRLFVPERSFMPGAPSDHFDSRVRLGPSAVGQLRAAPDEELQDIVKDAHEAPKRQLPYIEWEEWATTVSDPFAAARHRVVRILVKRNGQWIPRPISVGADMDDDGGTGFITLLRATPELSETGIERHLMTAIWLGPIFDNLPGTEDFVFEVVRLDDNGSVVGSCLSNPFQADAADARPRPPVARCGVLGAFQAGR